MPKASIEFEEWEVVTVLKNVSLQYEGHRSGHRMYIAVATNHSYGEDVVCKGKVGGARERREGTGDVRGSGEGKVQRHVSWRCSRWIVALGVLALPIVCAFPFKSAEIVIFLGDL